MTRRSTEARQPSATDQDSGTFEVPTHWTPAQATAVFEVLDELREAIWRNYGVQIQQEMHRDRVVTTSATSANLCDRDVPF